MEDTNLQKKLFLYTIHVLNITYISAILLLLECLREGNIAIPCHHNSQLKRNQWPERESEELEIVKLLHTFIINHQGFCNLH